MVIDDKRQRHQSALEAAWYALNAANGCAGRLMLARAEQHRTEFAIELGRHDMPPDVAQQTVAELEAEAAAELVAFDMAVDAMITAVNAERAARAVLED